MYCHVCGAELPDDAVYCMKCGASTQVTKPKVSEPSSPVVAPMNAVSLNCPKCGGPVSPRFGEMIVTCEYCGSAVVLSGDGWRGVQKQTMLMLKYADRNVVMQEIHDLMDRGLLHRHLQEGSTLEEMNVSFVPYWIVSVSARTSVIASDVAVEGAQVATTAALFGVMGGAFGGRRGGGVAGPLMAGAVLGGMMGQQGRRKTYELDNNYNFPVVALKALSQYQPVDYQFVLDDRALFDVNKVPKGVKILNGDVGEESAMVQAKTLVSQLQNELAHENYHMIQQLHTDVDTEEAELLYAPIWFARYDHRGHKIALVIDGNTAKIVNSIGL